MNFYSLVCLILRSDIIAFFAKMGIYEASQAEIFNSVQAPGINKGSTIPHGPAYLQIGN